MSASSLSIVNGLIFDGRSTELVEAAIHVVDGVITEVGEPPRPADRVIDAQGATVLPGLIDAHFHAYAVDQDVVRIEMTSLSYIALAGARRLEAALRRGFTTVRDVAGGDAGLARAIDERVIASPRYLWTGPALSQTGGHGDIRAADADFHPCHSHLCEVVDGVDAIRLAVRDRFRRGAHAIKVMASGGVSSPTDSIRVPQFSAEELGAASEEAGRRGSYVAAHAYSAEAVRRAVENGVRSIEHGNLIDAATAELMADRGAYLVQTLIAYDAMSRRSVELGLSSVAQSKNREVLESGQAAISLACAAGVPVGFGTDLMGAIEDEQLVGLRLQSEVQGLLGTVQSATTVNAALLGRSDLGRVAVGCVADLLLLDGNPFIRPSLLWDSPERRTIIQHGFVVSV